jgi:hypothetical protein
VRTEGLEPWARSAKSTTDSRSCNDHRDLRADDVPVRLLCSSLCSPFVAARWQQDRRMKRHQSGPRGSPERCLNSSPISDVRFPQLHEKPVQSDLHSGLRPRPYPVTSVGNVTENPLIGGSWPEFHIGTLPAAGKSRGSVTAASTRRCSTSEAHARECSSQVLFPTVVSEYRVEILERVPHD